jgi:hypothetical protein
VTSLFPGPAAGRPRLTVYDAPHSTRRERAAGETPQRNLFHYFTVNLLIPFALALKLEMALTDEILQRGREVTEEFFQQAVEIMPRNIKGLRYMVFELIIPHLYDILLRNPYLSNNLPVLGQIMRLF